MAKLLSAGNLRAYWSKAGKRKGFPNWPLADLLYLCIPVLAIRNLDFDYTNGDAKFGALCWKGGQNQSIALGVTGAILTRWQAFRPLPAKKLLQKLEKEMPRIVANFQNKMRSMKIRTIRDIRPHSSAYSKAVIELAKAVADISQLKSKKARTPMMGSKILHFLLPEFFPVWDTFWIKEKVLAKYFSERHSNLPESIQILLERTKLSRGDAYYESAREYASYVHIMITELSDLNKIEHAKLTQECINKSEIGYEVVEYHFSRMDMSPILFETCLLGKYC